MDSYQLPSAEQIEEIRHALESLEGYVMHLRAQIKAAEAESKSETELRPDVYGEIANKNRKTKVRQFQARPLNKQAVATAEILQLRDTLLELQSRVEDTLLVAQWRAFEKAKVVHQALREASKTNPSLLPAVQELDELYRQAEEEQQELNAPEDKGKS